MNRTEQLKQDVLHARHKEARIAVRPEWSTAHLPLSLEERKGEALAAILENMPLYIGPGELIVGSRTVFGSRGEDKDRSDMSIFALPECLTEAEIELYGKNAHLKACGHFTPDYSVILREGISGILNRCGDTPFQRSVARVYRALSNLIQRYADYAAQCSETADEERRRELLSISENCRAIAMEPPKTFWQAAQLLWFSHLSLLIESFQFVSYGRLDQILYAYSKPEEAVWEQQLVDCLVLKMYDGGDVVDSYFGTYSGQHTLTLGGLTPEGEDAVNRITYQFLDAVGRVGLPEPMVEIRWNETKNPPEFLEAAARVSIKGINTIAYYRDELFVRNLKACGVPERDANNYGFGLCQDVLVPGKLKPFVPLDLRLGHELLDTLRKVPDNISWDALYEQFLQDLLNRIDGMAKRYNEWCSAIEAYCAGERDGFLARVRAGELTLHWYGNSPVAPLPLASPLFEGCLEADRSLALYSYALPFRGMVIGNAVVGFNGLAAIRRVALEEKRYTISEIVNACDQNFEGQEIMRQHLWNAPKWGNGDDYVDGPARAILEACCRRISQHRTIWGTQYLAGIHQAHPVATGWKLQATPEGRKAGEPVPVTLSPENGTLRNGPTAAFQSVSKLDDTVYHWNICLMLTLSASMFGNEKGVSTFCSMLRTYFHQGGPQFQPNIVSLKQLHEAQRDPESYRDLVVRLWGVSVQFINLPREIQDEFIARFPH